MIFSLFLVDAESIRMTLKSGNKSIQSRRMFYSTNNSDKQNLTSNEFALKFLRIAITRPQDSCPESHFPPTREPVILNW
jgi:hypothetical protein